MADLELSPSGLKGRNDAYAAYRLRSDGLLQKNVIARSDRRQGRLDKADAGTD